MALRQATILSMLTVLMLIFNNNLAFGHKYYVGHDHKWTYMTANWTDGKKFHAGDILVFRYNPEKHNVVSVNAYDYSICRASIHSKVYQSGNDHIELKKGNNYFICGIPGHCGLGMNIIAKAK